MRKHVVNPMIANTDQRDCSQQPLILGTTGVGKTSWHSTVVDRSSLSERPLLFDLPHPLAKEFL